MADDKDNWVSDFWALEEAQCARNAVEKMRMGFLVNSIDSLADRIADSEQMIAEGKITYEHAFKSVIKPQIERVVEAKNRVLDTASLPSVITAGLRGE